MSYLNSYNFELEDFEDLVKSIKLSQPSFFSLNYTVEEMYKNYNYILTEKAKNRLDKIYTYITKGIPVLLEGETGTSKTFSAETICKYIYDLKNRNNPNNSIKESFIKFNLNAEVTINDLIQKFIANENTLIGLQIVDGPFLKAFKEGIPLILENINLASEDILQCIEEALDYGEINMDISGIGNIHYEKKEGFCLIAT